MGPIIAENLVVCRVSERRRILRLEAAAHVVRTNTGWKPVQPLFADKIRNAAVGKFNLARPREVPAKLRRVAFESCEIVCPFPSVNEKSSNIQLRETKRAPTNNALQLLPTMRDELLIRLGKGCMIHVSQVKGQRLVIGVKRRHSERWSGMGFTTN